MMGGMETTLKTLMLWIFSLIPLCKRPRKRSINLGNFNMKISRGVDLSDFTRYDATHLLKCKQTIGGEYIEDYFMRCIPLNRTRKGRTRIILFGERNWEHRKDKKGLRWVESDRIIEPTGQVNDSEILRKKKKR